MHLAPMLAHHHRPDLQMPHWLSPSPGEPIEALAHLAAELAEPLLLDAMGEHAGDEIARQCPWRALPCHLEPERPKVIEAERSDVSELGRKSLGGKRFRFPP
jgi:hypothetical protein